MSECFSGELERCTGTAYDLVLLYATVNEGFDRHIGGMPVVLFECVGPIDPKSGDLVNPSSTAYEWVVIGDVPELSNDRLENSFWVLIRSELMNSEEMVVQPWELPQWFKATTEAATSTLANLGYTVTGPFEQHQISPIAAVLRVATTKGRVYLKASTKAEGRIVQCASTFAPFLVPKPLYVKEENAWFLMEDYGQTLTGRFSLTDLNSILILYGKLQMASVVHVPDLLTTGLKRQGAEVIFVRTKKMLEDDRVRDHLSSIEGFAPIHADGKADLTECSRAVSVFLKRIYGERLPLTLNHGDLWPDNLIKEEDCAGKYSYVMFDWGNAEIDMPLSDISVLESHLVPQDQGKPFSIDAYLELWEEYGSLSELKDLYHRLSWKTALLKMLSTYEYSTIYHFSPLLQDIEVNRLGRILQYIQNSTGGTKKTDSE